MLTNIFLVRWLRKLSHFKAFYNDWLDCSGMINETGEHHKVNLSTEFFANLKFDSESVRQYRIDAAIRCAETLGDRPALCLSGGVDSQAMVQCFYEAGLKFDIIILKFNDDLNTQDSEHAKLFCESKGYPYIELPLNVVFYLTRENFVTGSHYKSLSPQFNVHYKMAEMLYSMGYTGVCCGGLAPLYDGNFYGYNFDKIPFHFVKAQDKFKGAFQGSFLSFSPELAWAITLQSEIFDTGVALDGSSKKFNNWEVEQELNRIRYQQKVDSYIKVGFDIIPQVQKFTGFENVKTYFEKLTGDGWTFEKQFRYPLTTAFAKDKIAYRFELTPEQLDVITMIHFNNLRTSKLSSSGVGVQLRP